MGLATVLWGVSAHAQVATLSASEITLAPGEGGVVQVSGEISGYVSYGVTILVELVPQPGTVGQLVFTHAPPVDVHQLGDPWPTVGTFTPFDTNATAFGPTLNGSVDDDGQFVCENLTTYSGLLAGFPVKAADNAWGVWDVLLSTSVGKSNWECVADVDPKGGVETELFAGTITVTTNVPAASTWGLTIFTLLLGTTGTLLIRRNNRGSTLPALSNA